MMKEKKPHLTSSATEIILESISDGVFTVDQEWHIMSFNRAAEEVTGIPREEAIGRYCWEIFRSNMCQKDCALKKTMKEGEAFVNSSTSIINNEGQRVPISVSTSLLKDVSGKILGGVETFRDRSVIEQLRRELSGSAKMGDMVSRCSEMKKIFSILTQVAESDSTVLIEGETGTGKEILARAIHSKSGRKDSSFVAINCGALPDTLLESELFGYKAGAFTGANHDKPGLFASAKNGTILLDEIGDTSPAFQVKLLRLLEEKEFQPLGSVNTIKTNARIVAATNRNLSEMMQSENFRQDLFYRINIVHINLPPLRHRMEDIQPLIEHFILKMNTLKGCRISGITPEASAILMAHDYPGNIRELENIIEHCFVLCSEGNIDIEHLPSHLTTITVPTHTKKLVPHPEFSLQSAIHLTEKEIIERTLRENNFNRKATALQLGMHKSTLFRKIKKLKINLPDTDGRSVLLPSSPSSSENF
jgi:PAS domain S-box-containing protein